MKAMTGKQVRVARVLKEYLCDDVWAVACAAAKGGDVEAAAKALADAARELLGDAEADVEAEDDEAAAESAAIQWHNRAHSAWIDRGNV